MPLFRTTPPLGNNLRSLFYCYPPSTSTAPIVRKGITNAKIRKEDEGCYVRRPLRRHLPTGVILVDVQSDGPFDGLALGCCSLDRPRTLGNFSKSVAHQRHFQCPSREPVKNLKVSQHNSKICVVTLILKIHLFTKNQLKISLCI